MQTVDIKYFRIWAELLPNGRTVELAGEYPVRVGDYHITVPRGFQSDFASIPRLFWAIIPPMGLHSGPAIVHDYLYTHHQYTDSKTQQVTKISRLEADMIFLQLLLYAGVSKLRASLMFYGVRWFGEKAWQRKGWDKRFRKSPEPMSQRQLADDAELAYMYPKSKVNEH